MAKTRVYISSTFADLKDYRAKVIEMLEKSGDDVECMEKYAAADERPQDKCRQDASNCDVYVCILGWRYGFIPKQDNPDRKSITELEYEAAPKGRRLSFQLKDGFPWSPPLMDSHTSEGKRGKLIRDFRARARNEAINDFFTTPDDLAVKVLAAVRKRETERRNVSGVGQTRWLQEYAQKMEANFFAHLYQRQQPDHAAAQTRYIEVLVCESPLDKGADKKVEVEPRPLSDMATQPSLRALVIGGGGSGKTSLFRKLASDYCRRALADTGAPLPFFSRLNFFDTHTDVLNGLLNVVAREADLSTDDLLHLWSAGSRRCLFLLDGLNEVRPEFGDDCRRALQRLTEKAPHTYLISSRSGDQAAELQRQLGGIMEVEILHLDTNQITTYLQRVGAGDLCNRMEDRLLSLAQNPFLLWAIVESCVGLPSYELPRNVGQLYKNLIDGYIFGKREVSKPQESRPTRYNYALVKKPVLARLAVEMCRQGATRAPEDNATLESIRGHLYELRDSNAGIRLLQPHLFMPEPFATDLLDECIVNGILQRSSSTLEFMHESVRDYFAAVELSEWPVERVLQNVSPLIWRHVEPDYDEMHLEGTLVQAIIMSSGLRVDAGNLLQQLVDHHPLLAAHCFAGARDIAPELEEDLLRRWLSLLDRRLTRYRWVGCQCLRAAKVASAELACRLFEVLRSDSEWQVRKSAALALAGINNTQLTRDLVAQALNDIPEDYGEDNLGDLFRHLQTDTLIVELLVAWGDTTQTHARKSRVEQLFAKMRRSSVRQALQRLAGQAGNTKPGEVRVSQLAQAALDGLDSWKALGIPHAEDFLTESMDHYARRFQTEINKWLKEMSTWPRADTIGALKDPCAEKRAAAACSVVARKMEAIAELVEAFARERHGRVSPILEEILRALEQPEVLYVEWQTRIRDQRWPLLFSVGPDFADDLAKGDVSERWTNEFKQHQIELSEHSHITPQEEGWMIYPGSYGGKLHDNPVYRLRQWERKVEVFDAGMRPRLVAMAEMIGPRAMPVLKELLAEKDKFLRMEAAETLGKIATPEALALLSELLSKSDHDDEAKAAIEGLKTTQSKHAIQPLIEALRTSGPAHTFGGEVGGAIGALNGVTNLIQFANGPGMRGDQHCRLATVLALSDCGYRGLEIEELLLTAANDAEPRVRRAAVAGLGGIKSSNSEEKLSTISLEDVDEGIRAEAGQALRHLPGDAAVTKLVTALESGKDELCIHAAEALARIQDDRAIPALTKLLESNLPSIRVAAAKTLNALGFDQVETLIQVLCPLARTAPDIMVRQEAARALDEIPSGKDKLYQPIMKALTDDRYDEVIQLIGTDTPFLLDDVNLYWWRAVARHSLKRYQDALMDLDRAIALTDCDAVVHRTRAQVLANLNRFPGALAAAEKAAEIEPEEAVNHFQVGWYAYQAKEFEKSVTASRHALQLDPKLAGAEFNLGLALLASGQGLQAINAYIRGIILCAELNEETALTTLDDASGDLDALIVERPQSAASAAEVRTRLQQARDASLHRNQ